MKYTHGEDSIFAEERKRLIVSYVNEREKATVSELGSEFSVSPATIRNDLRELSNSGLLSRTHGGAMSNVGVKFEPNTQEKKIIRVYAKTAIAAAAVNYIHEGDSIALDAGTTGLELAKLIVNFKNLTVVTYDLNIANYLDMNSNVSVIIAGGQIRKGFHYSVGDLAQLTIRDLNVDVAFLAANGVHCEKGISTPTFETASLKRTLIQNSKLSILITDSSKINNVSFAKFADLDEIDIIITDDDAEEYFISEAGKKGVKAVVVKMPEGKKDDLV